MPAPDALDYDRVRRDTGASAAALPDAEIDLLYDEAAETYATAGADQDALVRVLALQGILASSAKLVSYRQADTQQSDSDVFAHVKDLLDYWRSALAAAAAANASATTSSLRLAGMRRFPKRIREYPDG